MSVLGNGDPIQVREELLEWCRAEQIEPPSAGRIERIVRSALHSGELALVLRISAQLAPATVQGISALIDDGEHGDGDTSDNEPPMLAVIKEAPGNVSLETLLAEIGRLLRVRAIDLPADLFDDLAPKGRREVAGEGGCGGHRRICVSIRNHCV
jgi:hypothetical protein